MAGRRGRTVAQSARECRLSWPVAHAAFTASAALVLSQPPALVAHLGIDEHRRGRPRWRADPETGEYVLLADRWHTCFFDLSGDQGLLGQVEGRTADGRPSILTRRWWRTSIPVPRSRPRPIYAAPLLTRLRSWRPCRPIKRYCSCQTSSSAPTCAGSLVAAICMSGSASAMCTPTSAPSNCAARRMLRRRPSCSSIQSAGARRPRYGRRARGTCPPAPGYCRRAACLPPPARRRPGRAGGHRNWHASSATPRQSASGLGGGQSSGRVPVHEDDDARCSTPLPTRWRGGSGC
jgi:hypothetical protein